MPKDERYDFVIVGGGPNGVALAAYLGRCGASVCVLEERPEAGGACENTEPIAGVRITPTPCTSTRAPAPGFEQLELQRYGFRMDWSPISENLGDASEGGVLTTEGVAPLTDKDVMGWAKISGMLGQPPFIKDLLRAIFWCPPHPPEVEVTAENIPYMQVYKQHQPDVWTEELLDMTLFDLMDEYCETRALQGAARHGGLVFGGCRALEGRGHPGPRRATSPAHPVRPDERPARRHARLLSLHHPLRHRPRRGGAHLLSGGRDHRRRRRASGCA